MDALQMRQVLKTLRECYQIHSTEEAKSDIEYYEAKIRYYFGLEW